MGVLHLQGLQAHPVAPSPSQSLSYRQFSPTLTRRARSGPLCPVAQTWSVALPTTNKIWVLGSGVRHVLLHVCASAEPGLTRQWTTTCESRERIPSHGAHPQKSIPDPSAASFLTSDACDGLSACCLLACLMRAPCQSVTAIAMPTHQLTPPAATRKPI